jgi:hypothetical protein
MMDDYPETLGPLVPAPFQKEPFPTWWARAQSHFAIVPRNVARQWLWRHWGQSEYGWLPTRGAHFALQVWSPSEVYSLAVHRVESNERWAKWGSDMLKRADLPKNQRYPLYSIMKRRKRWPTPPIVLDNRIPIESPCSDLPAAFVLVEGHQRTAIAKALAQRGQLARDLPVWVLSYR